MATSEPEINIALAETLDALRASWREARRAAGAAAGLARPARHPRHLDRVRARRHRDGGRPRRDGRGRRPRPARRRAHRRLAHLRRHRRPRPPQVPRPRGEALRNALRRTDAGLEYALLAGASRDQHDRFPDAGWLVGGATDLARLAYQASIPLRAIENAADRLEARLDRIGADWRRYEDYQGDVPVEDVAPGVTPPSAEPARRAVGMRQETAWAEDQPVAMAA